MESCNIQENRNNQKATTKSTGCGFIPGMVPYAVASPIHNVKSDRMSVPHSDLAGPPPPVVYPIPREAYAVLEADAEQRAKRWNPKTAHRIITRMKQGGEILGATNRILTLYRNDGGEYFFSCHYVRKTPYDRRTVFNINIPVTESYAQFWRFRHYPSDCPSTPEVTPDPQTDPNVPDSWFDDYIIGRWMTVASQYLHTMEAFVYTCLLRCQWKFVPYGFLEDLHASWFYRNQFPGDPLVGEDFKKEINHFVVTGGSDACADWAHIIHCGCAVLDCQEWNPEPLIEEYELTQWMDLRNGFTGKSPRDLLEWCYANGLTRCSYWQELVEESQQ